LATGRPAVISRGDGALIWRVWCEADEMSIDPEDVRYYFVIELPGGERREIAISDPPVSADRLRDQFRLVADPETGDWLMDLFAVEMDADGNVVPRLYEPPS
jgi:hypothetical protein